MLKQHWQGNWNVLLEYAHKLSSLLKNVSEHCEHINFAGKRGEQIIDSEPEHWPIVVQARVSIVSRLAVVGSDKIQNLQRLERGQTGQRCQISLHYISRC